MVEKQDYLIYDSGLLMSSKQPLKQVDCCVVGTKNKIFFIPKKTVGMFLVLNTIKSHKLFDGVSIEVGTRKLISEVNSLEDLESSLTILLENDEKYVHDISEQKAFKFRGFLGKHTLKMGKGGMNWTSVLANGNGNSKEMRAFYGQ